MDEDLNSVMQQAAPEVSQDHNQVDINKEKEADELYQQKNFREMRQRQKELERELGMQREMNEKLMKMSLANQPAPAQVIDELDQLSDDEFIPKGKVKQLLQKEKAQFKREAVEEVERVLNQREQAKFLDHLKAKFSDFDDVVNPETMALLEEKDPELAQTIVDLKDPYKIGMQTYKYIKAMNIVSKVSDSKRAKEVDKKLEQNAKTVQSPQAYDKRPMAQAFKMTDTDYKDLYKEMMGFAKQAGSVPEMAM